MSGGAERARRRSLRERLRAVPPRALLGTLAGLGAYLLAMSFATGLRPEQVLISALVVGLVAWSEATRRFAAGMLPFVLFAIAYDLTHFLTPLLRHLYVHVREPYAFELRVFGIEIPGGVLTPNEWLALHQGPVLDFVSGLAYIFFVWWAIGFGAWLGLTRRDEAGQRLLRRFGWTFLGMNLAGFATYFVYPAAPPWYVAAHGFGPADLTVRPSMAGAARWDALTGIPYFHEFYGRGAAVFGAIPSLHVSYPLLTFLFGLELRRRALDAASLGVFALVCFAAVYLDHHYVLDVLLGVLYAVVAWRISAVRERRRAAVARRG